MRRRAPGDRKLAILRSLWWCRDGGDDDLRWLGRQAELLPYRQGDLIAEAVSPRRWLYVDPATGATLGLGSDRLVAAVDGDVLVVPRIVEEELRRRFPALPAAGAARAMDCREVQASSSGPSKRSQYRASRSSNGPLVSWKSASE